MLRRSSYFSHQAMKRGLGPLIPRRSAMLKSTLFPSLRLSLPPTSSPAGSILLGMLALLPFMTSPAFADREVRLANCSEGQEVCRVEWVDAPVDAQPVAARQEEARLATTETATARPSLQPMKVEACMERAIRAGLAYQASVQVCQEIFGFMEKIGVMACEVSEAS